VLESANTVFETNLPGLISRGKVRDIYDLGDRLMIVATDRISAFDVVMDQPVPGKGVVLTQMSKFWLETLPACAPHHLLYVVSDERVPPGHERQIGQLRGRTMVVRKAAVLPVECVVRGYIIGGGWKEYHQTGRVSGIKLRAGLRLAEMLPEPLFTPSTKATDGHDEPISFERACEIAEGFARQTVDAGATGRALMETVRERSLAIYAAAARHAEQRGLILADTKFEFGLCEGELLLVDEVLTPDSSRFWPANKWEPGTNPPSFDTQFLRDYLNTLDWPKRPPPPPIPDEIIAQTRQRYLDAYQLLTGSRVSTNDPAASRCSPA
jgi:phosphoribosylaminoimidazole-succinocarboxamide synthase